jgi:hypothetical protein
MIRAGKAERRSFVDSALRRAPPRQNENRPGGLQKGQGKRCEVKAQVRMTEFERTHPL